MKNKGFTLIELMIVIAIIGLLASIALPAYQDYVARSQTTESIILASSLKPAVVDVWNQFGTLSVANSGSNGIPSALSVTGKYVSQVVVISGVITATLNGDSISPSIAGTNLILTPDTTSSTGFSWICTGSMPQRLKPKACQ